MKFIRMLFPVVTVLIPLSVALSVAEAEDLDPGKKFKAPLSELYPTQFSVGMKEVEIRKKKIQSLLGDPDKLKAYLKENRALVVLGPEEKIYLVDGHHLATALNSLGIDQMHAKVAKDWSKISESEFWEKMKKHNFVYLRDQSGHLRPVSELPRHISDLTDDPYRSLAWLVRKAGGYSAEEAPFQEFVWAEYFRKNVPAFDPTNDAEFEKAIKNALALCQKPEAATLPGFLGKKAPQKCALQALVNELTH